MASDRKKGRTTQDDTNYSVSKHPNTATTNSLSVWTVAAGRILVHSPRHFKKKYEILTLNFSKFISSEKKMRPIILVALSARYTPTSI
jgi:hypothetical protein